MYESVKIGIFGGDIRQAFLARRLAEEGFECATFGLSSDVDIGNAVRCTDVFGAIKNSKVVLLPLPATKDKINVNMPYSSIKMPILELVNMLSPGTILVGGMLDESAKNAAKERKIAVFDYAEDEEFQVKNAFYTAEGALEIAIRETDFSLFDSNALVLGYGRIGKALLSVLSRLFRTVFVAARRPSDRAYIDALGGKSLDFSEEKLLEISGDLQVVFNTVPSLVLTESVIEKLPQNCLIIDLASGKGGIDFDAAERYKIKTVHALALPGKVAPESAANAVGDYVLSLLKRERGDGKI